MRTSWAVSLLAVAVAAGAGGFALGRSSAPTPAGGPTSAELAFARLLAQGDTAAEAPAPAVVAQPAAGVTAVDPAVAAYAARVLALADRDGGDPRRLPLLRAAAAGLAPSDIADADRDGLDDDGKVQLGSACVLLPIAASYRAEFAAGSCAAATAHPTVTGELEYGPKPFPESYLRTL